MNGNDQQRPAGGLIKHNILIFNYKKNRLWAENLQILMQVGLTMVGCIAFCFFIGRYLDRWIGTKGFFTTILTILGVAGGANVVYRQVIGVLVPGQPPKSDRTGRGSD
jgi:F0F1-type ATP synthase assembly protein I